MELFLKILGNIWLTGRALAPSLILGLIIAGLLHVFVKRERIFSHLGKPGFLSAVKASMMGVPLPLCSCGVLPAALSLRRDGASKGATVSFLASTPQTGVDSIIPTWIVLGWPVAAAKVIAAFLAGVASGSLVDLLEGRHRAVEPNGDQMGEKGGSFLPRIWRYAWGTLFGDIYGWLFLGIAVSALIVTFIEPGSLAEYDVLSGPAGMLAALAVGIPMYVCSVSSIPMAAALIYAGFPVGGALVFLMAGPATNAATMGAIRKELGTRAFSVYILTIVAAAMLSGLVLNNIDPGTIPLTGSHDHGAAWEDLAAGLLFAGITLKGIDRLLRRRRMLSGGRVTVLRITGMKCRRCSEKVERALLSVAGVTGAEVSSGTGTARVISAVDPDPYALEEAVEKAGFSVEGKPGKEVCREGTCCR